MMSKFYAEITFEQFWARLVQELGHFSSFVRVVDGPASAEGYLGQFVAGPNLAEENLIGTFFFAPISPKL